MFKLSQNAYDWFSPMIKKNPFSGAAQMDVYHLCFTLTANMILAGTHEPLQDITDPRQDFIDHWPEQYRGKHTCIIGLLLEAEIARKSYDKKDKVMIKKFISELLDADNQAKLSTHGADIMNRYSYNGYLKLKKELKDKPQDTTTFLVGYTKVLSEFI